MQSIDLQRYAGRWYIIANIPYFAERGKVGSFFDVSFDRDRVTDVYNGRTGTLDAKNETFVMKGYVQPGTGNARWRESPLWPIYFSYLIVYVDSGYRTALVGYPGNDFGWILSRSPTMDEPEYQALLHRFAEAGADPGLFRRVPQMPDQIGQPGFQ